MARTDVTAAVYRGVDRRDAAPARVVRLPLLPSLVSVVVAIGVVLAVTTAEADRRLVVEVLRLAATALLVGAGVLSLARWRMTGLTRPGLIGAALVLLGLVGEVLGALWAAFGGGERLPTQVTSTVAAAGAVWLLLWARRGPAIDAGARPVRSLVRVALVVPLLCLVALASTAPFPDAASGVVVVAGMLVAGGWVALAVSEQRAGLDGKSPWLVTVLALTASVIALRTVGTLRSWPYEPVGAVLAVAAGAVAVHGAFRDVLAAAAAQSSRLLRLSVEVSDSQRRELTAEQVEQERLHEVRNVLAGLHAATATLRKYEDRLDPGVRRRLEDAVSGELQRLAHLIDPAAETPLRDVPLAPALDAVVAAEREAGADLEVDLDEHWVRARQADLATVVSVLLVNARRHAPGSAVRLRATRLGGEVQVSVSDRGSGVALDRREAVFERGERAGASAPGQGLGLYVARRLASEMGGTLGVDARTGGGAHFVLTLAAGSSGDVSAGSVDEGVIRRAQLGKPAA